MVNLYRLIFSLLLLIAGAQAMADGGPFPATKVQPTGSCTPANFPRSYQGDSNVSASWVCGGVMGAASSCGWVYVAPAYGWGGNQATGVVSSQCNLPAPTYSCPAGANSSGSGDSTACTCAAGLRPSNGQCVALPVCPEGQHEEGGACVPDNCKANETRVNGVCVPEPPCPAGESRVNGKCVPFKCPTQGTVSDQWYDLDSSGKSSTCLFNGQDKTYCTMTVEPSVVAYKDGKPSYYGGYGVYTGGTCGPSEPGKPVPVDPAKPNGDPGDGTKPPGKGDPKPGDKPGGGPGGPGNNPTPPGSDGKCPDGTYKSGNSCYQKDPPRLPPDGDGKCPAGYIKADGQCLPIMPKPNDSDGDGKDDDEEDKDKSSFGGQCEAVQCDGDAIQCAMVRDQYKRSCQLMEKESAESQLYGTSKGKTGDQTGDLPGNFTASIADKISTTDALGAGNVGLSDLSVTVMDQQISLPFSMLNQYLAAMGNVLLAVSFLLAFRIVSRG